MKESSIKILIKMYFIGLGIFCLLILLFCICYKADKAHSLNNALAQLSAEYPSLDECAVLPDPTWNGGTNYYFFCPDQPFSIRWIYFEAGDFTEMNCGEHTQQFLNAYYANNKKYDIHKKEGWFW